MNSSRWIVNGNGAWCWFQDERSLVIGQTLVIGSVAAPEGADGSTRTGDIDLTVVDLATGGSEVVVLHAGLEADDHNAPALWLRPDGRLLAAYTRHKTDDLTRWRISEPGDFTQWGPEQVFDWSQHTGGRGVTYSNLHRLGDRLVCFARAVNDDPCAVVSGDNGDGFNYAGQLVTRPKVGYVNGYTRYAGHPDGARIDFVTTDHHPRDYDNSIYHGTLLPDGRLVDAAGRVAAEQVPGPGTVSQAELTTVLPTGTTIAGARLSHAWTTDLRRGADGSLAAILSARADDDEETSGSTAGERDGQRHDHRVADIRLVYARLAPGDTEWTVHQLCPAGPGLLPHEQDYSGLASIDPDDLDQVYASTPIDPRTGERLAHHEIWHGRTDDAGASWQWTPVTEASEVDNLRPIVAPRAAGSGSVTAGVGSEGDGATPGPRVLCWFAGTMTASQHYDCQVVVDVAQR